MISISGESISFEFIEKQIRKKTFGILSTISPKNYSQSTGVVYGVSSPNSEFSIMIITEEDTIKVRNIKQNPNVSFFIPFPHHFLRFVPANMVTFQAKAEVLNFDDDEGHGAFKGKRILEMNIQQATKPSMKDKAVFLKIKPNGKLNCYGLGINLMKLARNIEIGSYYVDIPKEKLFIKK